MVTRVVKVIASPEQGSVVVIDDEGNSRCVSLDCSIQRFILLDSPTLLVSHRQNVFLFSSHQTTPPSKKKMQVAQTKTTEKGLVQEDPAGYVLDTILPVMSHHAHIPAAVLCIFLQRVRRGVPEKKVESRGKG